MQGLMRELKKAFTFYTCIVTSALEAGLSFGAILTNICGANFTIIYIYIYVAY